MVIDRRQRGDDVGRAGRSSRVARRPGDRDRRSRAKVLSSCRRGARFESGQPRGGLPARESRLRVGPDTNAGMSRCLRCLVLATAARRPGLSPRAVSCRSRPRPGTVRSLGNDDRRALLGDGSFAPEVSGAPRKERTRTVLARECTPFSWGRCSLHRSRNRPRGLTP